MTLVLGTYPVWRAAEVWPALVEIVGCDPGLEYVVHSFYSGQGLLVNFEQQVQPATPSSNRILELVKSPNVIVVYGAGSGYENKRADGTKATLKETGGGTTNTFPDYSCGVYIDVEEANGQRYRYIASDGTGTVTNPLCNTLYHELSHAYHWSIAHDVPAKFPDYERQIRVDTNRFLPTIGLPTESLTDYTNPLYGEPTNKKKHEPCKATTTGFSLCTCNIATATLGSPAARQIAEFRRAKREFERLTLGSVPVLEPMMSSYQLFSPLVAGDIRGNSRLREAMLHFGVQPAVHLLQIVRSHISARGDDSAVRAQADRSVSAYLTELPMSAVAQLGTAVGAARGAASTLGKGRPTNEPSGLVSANDVFASVVKSVRSTGADCSGPAWILSGIALFLDEATRHRDGRAGDPTLISALGTWLARVPLPRVEPRYGMGDLDRELALLRTTLFHHPANYDLFAQRVTATWPEARMLVNIPQSIEPPCL